MSENQKYTQRKKIMGKYRVNKLLFIIKKWIEWKEIFVTDENYHKNKNLKLEIKNSQKKLMEGEVQFFRGQLSGGYFFGGHFSRGWFS